MRKLLFLLVPLLLASPAALADTFPFFGTYWETGSGKSRESVGLGIPANHMKTAFDIHADDNMEMTHIDAYDVEGKVFFNFVFNHRQSASWTARWGMTGAQYQTFFDDNTGKGRCLQALDAYRVGTSVRYAAIFKKKGCVPQRAYHGLRASHHQSRFEDLADEGWDPVNVAVASVGGARTYAAFYEKRPSSFSLKSFMTTDGLGEHDSTMRNQGFRIVWMDIYTHDDNHHPRYSAIWRKVGKPVAEGANHGGPQISALGETMHDSNRYIRYLAGFGLGDSHRYNYAAIKGKPAFGGIGGISN